MYRPIVRKQWIQKSIQNSFSGMYLTMLSIIQGVALSLLVGKVFDTQTGCPNVYTCGIDYSLMCLLTLLIIIVMWHSYFWLAVIAAWTPLIWDSLFMFSIGAIEFIAVKSIGSNYWFYAVAAIGIVGGLQYLYNVAKLQEEAWDNDTKDLSGIEAEDGNRPKDIGAWICTYKTRRGWGLFGISLVLLGVTVLSHIFSWFSFSSIIGYSWIKVGLFFGISFGLGYSIYQHLDDQKTTLEKLE